MADDSTDSAVHTTRLITYHRGDSTPRGLRVHPPTRLRPTLTHTHAHTRTHAHAHAHTHSRTRTHPITPRPGLSAPTARCDLVTSPGARRRGLARPPRHTAPHLARPRGLARAHCIIQSGPEPSGTDFAPVSQSRGAERPQRVLRLGDKSQNATMRPRLLALVFVGCVSSATLGCVCRDLVTSHGTRSTTHYLLVFLHVSRGAYPHHKPMRARPPGAV